MISGPCRFESVRSMEAMEALEPEWWLLWQADPQATPFQSPQWLLPWWRSLGEGALCGVAARDQADRLIGWLPLYRYTQPTDGRRDRLLVGAGTSDYLGGLFAPDGPVDGEALARAMLEWTAAADGGEWDKTVLHQLRHDSLLLSAARSLHWPLTNAEECSVLPTDASSRPAKMRLNLGRYRRRAAAEGDLQVRPATTAQEAADALEILILLHTQRWESRGEAGVLAEPAVQRHHREAVPHLQQAGLLRMTTLLLNQKPLAVLYCLRDPAGKHLPLGRRQYGYLIGIDGQHSALSPGTLLLGEVLQQAADEGIATFDMLRGGEQYKKLWGASTESTFSLALAPGILGAS